MFSRRQCVIVLKNEYRVRELNAVLPGIQACLLGIPFEVHQPVYNRTPPRLPVSRRVGVPIQRWAARHRPGRTETQVIAIPIQTMNAALATGR